MVATRSRSNNQVVQKPESYRHGYPSATSRRAYLTRDNDDRIERSNINVERKSIDSNEGYSTRHNHRQNNNDFRRHNGQESRHRGIHRQDSGSEHGRTTGQRVVDHHHESQTRCRYLPREMSISPVRGHGHDECTSHHVPHRVSRISRQSIYDSQDRVRHNSDDDDDGNMAMKVEGRLSSRQRAQSVSPPKSAVRFNPRVNVVDNRRRKLQDDDDENWDLPTKRSRIDDPQYPCICAMKSCRRVSESKHSVGHHFFFQ